VEQGAFDDLARPYTAYYDLARSKPSARCPASATPRAVALRQMNGRPQALKATLEKNRADNVAQIDRAFRALKGLQIAGWVVTALMTILCVWLLIWLSRLTRARSRAGESVRVAHRLAVGRRQRLIDVHSTTSSDACCARCRRWCSIYEQRRSCRTPSAKATWTSRSRRGRPTTRSQCPRGDDALSRRYGPVADEISLAASTPTCQPRSDSDRFGKAFVQMTQSLSSSSATFA